MLYIYNIEQSNFYMENGVYPISCGINPKTKMIWQKKKKEDTKNVYEKWINRIKS